MWRDWSTHKDENLRYEKRKLNAPCLPRQNANFRTYVNFILWANQGISLIYGNLEPHMCTIYAHHLLRILNL